MRRADAETKWRRRLERAGSMLELLDSGGGCKALESGVVVGMRLLTDVKERGDVLLIVQARVGTEKYVGFCGGPDVVTAMLVWLKKEQAAGLAFRKDEPWSERVAREAVP